MVCPDCGEEAVKAYVKLDGAWLCAWICSCEVDEGAAEVGDKNEVSLVQEL